MTYVNRWLSTNEVLLQQRYSNVFVQTKSNDQAFSRGHWDLESEIWNYSTISDSSIHLAVF
jgi:hypothetical protein